MCGIVGWISWNVNILDKGEILSEMSNSLSHRGPDASGIWLSHTAGLAHRRLSVVDLENGAQPMIRKKDGNTYIISYNGELYNTLELKLELEKMGYTFSTTCDTEVLLNSYIEWGEKCVEKFNGIFAFGIWDESNQTLFLARDRFGVKPLFYSKRGNSLIFASELKALLKHPLVPAEINNDGLAEIFSLGPSRTPGHGVFNNVYEIKPGYCATYNETAFIVKPYWSLISKPHEDDLETTTEKVRELIVDSIRRQLVADVPVCTFLSGGLDSSAISAIASQYFIDKNKSQLNTFSIDYQDNDIYFKPTVFQPNSDSEWIHVMTDYLNTNHHNIIFDIPELVSSLADATKSRDLPGMADVDSSLHLFCKEIKKDFTVALSGECADEIFGGYPWFHNQETLSTNNFPWLRSLSERTKILSGEISEKINIIEYAEQRYQDTINQVPRLNGEDPIEARRREMFYLNLQWFMATLLDRKDRMSMAHGLEVRVPFCDYRIVEYVWNIPWEMKSYGGREKGIMRKALKGILPDSIVERKKSPYPKTHNPAYTKNVSDWLTKILNDKTSPLNELINFNNVKEIALSGGSSFTSPWFGQLMTGPQLIAYLIQVNIWLKEYNIKII